MTLLPRTLCLLLALAGPAGAADLIGFWDSPQHGANSFNIAPPDQGYFDALAATGASWVRLSPTKWPAAGRDFLLGTADGYDGIPPADLDLLRAELDRADMAGLKVVIAPLSLPGARWQQQNDGQFDQRLWTDPAYADQAVRFWGDLAAALKDHPAIAGYNILNEPAPERGTGLAENAAPAEQQAWYAGHQGTPRDLPALYTRIIAAIRAQDAVTPIMLDAGFYANARAFAYWPGALPDGRLLYAFHMYEPYEATSAPNMKRDLPLRYPGVELPYGSGTQVWDRAAVADHITAPFDWAAAHGIAPNRVVMGEFGCMRRWADCGTYLTDVLDAAEAQGGHWAFYAFREDGWEGMDYELAPSVAPGHFYWKMEQGQGDTLKRGGPLFDIIAGRLKP